jgi:hypothetical protein
MIGKFVGAVIEYEKRTWVAVHQDKDRVYAVIVSYTQNWKNTESISIPAGIVCDKECYLPKTNAIALPLARFRRYHRKEARYIDEKYLPFFKSAMIGYDI